MQSLCRISRRKSCFHYGQAVCLKPWHIESPCLPEHPPHVSVSLVLPRALASWGILPIGACGWLPSPANAGEPSIGYSVPKVHWFVALGRHFTPETIRGGNHPRFDWMTRISIPVWACVSADCAGFALRRLRTIRPP